MLLLPLQFYPDGVAILLIQVFTGKIRKIGHFYCSYTEYTSSVRIFLSNILIKQTAHTLC